MTYEIGVKFPKRSNNRDRALAYGRRYYLAVFEVNADGTRTRIDEDHELVIPTHQPEELSHDDGDL